MKNWKGREYEMDNIKLNSKKNIKAEVLKSLDNVEIVIKNIVLFGSGTAGDPDFENNSDGRVVIHKGLVQSGMKAKSEQSKGRNPICYKISRGFPT